jgi:hypothetical protein
VRFQLSQVLDAIEQRLTTDVAGAQAVVDLGQVIRAVELDRGRPVSLVRVGMVVDALSRYLVDSGALLYGVAERSLLSEGALTSKERMVLGRWADDGLIEITPELGDRVVEIADLTGLPMITLRSQPELTGRRPWLDDPTGRVLRVVRRDGLLTLVPSGIAADPSPTVTRTGAESQAPEDDPVVARVPVDTEPPPELPERVFTGRGAAPTTRTRVSWHRFLTTTPETGRSELLARRWRCPSLGCPVFGEHRRDDQPVPRLQGEVPVCPRHGEPVIDVGPREPAYPISIMVNDLPRRRVVVRAGSPTVVGRDEDDPEVISVAPWLHTAAARWISPLHLELVAEADGLRITDLSEHGTVVWQRTGPDDPGTTRTLRGESYLLGEWDSVELYTGIELMRGDRRLAAVLGQTELASVLRDAPTAAYRQLSDQR